jgi:hypothetical protein
MELDAVHAVVAIGGLSHCRIAEALIQPTLEAQDDLVLVECKDFVSADAIK